MMTPVRKYAPALAATLGFAVALFPIARWYVRRMGDGSDEPLGLIALAFAVVLAWSWRDSLRPTRASRAFGLAVLGIYGITVWLGFPPLLRALPALGAVVLWSGMWKLPGISLLLILSLPVVATMQFYLGYPMRIVTAEVSSATLNLLTYPVHRVGTQLLFDGSAFGVDAPCSGVRMLWMSSFFAAAVSALFRLGWLASAGLLTSAVAVTLVANSLRATALFFPEAGMIHLPGWGHEGAGLLLYSLGMVLLVTAGRRLQSQRPAFS